MTQTSNNPEVTKTGLSPEFHLASFKKGTADGFFVADLLSWSQSVNNQRSNPLRTSSVFTSTSCSSPSSVVIIEVVFVPSFSSSKYSFTCPLFLEIANLVLDTGTTEFAHTEDAITDKTSIDPIAIRADVSGSTGSKVVEVDVGLGNCDDVSRDVSKVEKDVLGEEESIVFVVLGRIVDIVWTKALVKVLPMLISL